MPRHTSGDDAERARQRGRCRQAKRSAAMQRRLGEAKTPEARMSTAFDWARSSLTRMSKQKTRTGAQPDRRSAERVMGEVTAYLASVGAEADGRCDGE